MDNFRITHAQVGLGHAVRKAERGDGSELVSLFGQPAVICNPVEHFRRKACEENPYGPSSVVQNGQSPAKCEAQTFR